MTNNVKRKQIKEEKMKNNYAKKVFYSTLGVILISLAVSLFRMADIGTDPFSCFNLGIANLTGISFGDAQLSTNIILTLILIYPGFKHFGFGPLLAMVGVGYISDFILYIFPFDASTQNMIIRILIVCAGILVTSTGIAMYSCTKFGISQYDAMSFILCEKSNGKIKLQYARIAVDLILILGGYLMGSVVGIGTVLIALAVGPVVSYLIPNVFNPIMNRDEKKAQ